MTAYQKLLDADIRRKPDAALIESIRARFPTEREIDRVLTQKMIRRGGKPYAGVKLEELSSGVRKLIAHNVGHDVEIANAQWLTGGASKLQMIFDLRGHGSENTVTKLVLRMEPAASVTESSRRREFQVLKAVAGVVPAPTPYWIDADAQFLPYPAMVYGFARGVAKPSGDADKVSGLGQNYGPALRAKIAPHFVNLLAALHRMDVGKIDGLADFERPQIGSNASVIRQVNYVRRLWEEDRLEEEPLLECVYKWLIRNAPKLDRVSIVHGDYRSGNFLFDETTGEITAWLDWEGATLGDRHQDLTYAALYTFQHMAEDGRTPLASGMMSMPDLLAAYEKASGFTVDPARIAYFEIFNRYLITVLSLGAAARAAAGGQSHQDVLLTYVCNIGYPLLEDLRICYERAVT